MPRASKKPALTPEQALQEKARRQASVAGRMTALAIANGHEIQRLILECLDQNLVLMCSRRAGKTEVCMGLLAIIATRTANTSNLYLALTSSQAKTVWNKKWKKLLRRFDITPEKGACEHNETDLVTTFANGSTVTFGGTDDLRHIQTLLGDSMAGGLAVIDECQSDPGLIETLAVQILGPMLDETTVEKPVPGRLVLAGTVPDAPVGYFWDTWERNFEVPGSLWRCFAWSRFDNPHLTNNRARLDEYLSKYGLTEDHPDVRRMFYGERVFSVNATAFRYSERNAYTSPAPAWVALVADQLIPGTIVAATPPEQLDTYAVGIDGAGKSDKFSIVVWGWGPSSDRVWQVFEWVTDRASNLIESQWTAVLFELTKRYPGIVKHYRDMTDQITVDTFRKDWGIIIEPAIKAGLKGRVDRFADLLGQGRAKVIAGSELEADLKLCRWDLGARAKGKWEWAAARHPDPAMAAGYALQAYFDFSEKKAPKLTGAELQDAVIRAMYPEELPAPSGGTGASANDNADPLTTYGPSTGWANPY